MHIPRMAMIALAAVLIAASSPGCGSGPQGPAGVLNAYSRALSKRNYEAAYEMMSSGFRDKHSKEEFIRMMKENPKEVDNTADRLGTRHDSLEISAEFQYGTGDEMRLVQEDGQWRIATNPVAYYGQATPREALRSFVRAYRLKRWEIMLRYVPNQYRERMTPEKIQRQFEGESREDMDVMMKMLEANLDEPISDKGNEARMPYGDRYEVKFIREDGLWKIRDID